MKAYLLGRLSASDEIALEQQYFQDSRLLDRLMTAESELIEDYLSKRLSAPEHTKFEERYLKNPALAQKVEAARQRNNTVRDSRRPTSVGLRWWAWAAPATALALLALFTLPRPSAPDEPGTGSGSSTSAQQKRDRPPAIVPAVLLTLAPGINKGGQERTNEVRLTPGTPGLKLALELPGEMRPQLVQVRLVRVAGDGATQLIAKRQWASQAGLPAGRGMKAEGLVEAELLPPGDYLVELSGLDGVRKDTYSFRVIAEN